MTIEIVSRPGFYRYSLDDPPIEITLDRFHETARSVYAEIVIRMNGQHKLRTTKDLTSDTGKASLSKRLRELSPDTGWADAWDDIIEFAAENAIRQFRQGEPISSIGDRPLRRTPTWRLYPIVPEQLPAILFGSGGSLKSLLALTMGLSVQTGIPLLGWEPVKGNVLYLDWELSGDEMNERILRLQAGLQLPEAPLIRYKRCDRALADIAPELISEVAENDIVMVIVDSCIAAVGAADSNRPENVSPLFATLRQLGVSSLLISHISQEQRETNGRHRKPFASVFWENWARHIFEVRAAEEENNPRPVALFNTKTNVAGRLRPMGYSVDFNDELGDIIIRRRDVSLVQEFSDAIPIRQRIEALLAHGSLTFAEIAAELGAKESTVQKDLSRLKTAGRVITVGGKWGLAARNIL